MKGTGGGAGAALCGGTGVAWVLQEDRAPGPACLVFVFFLRSIVIPSSEFGQNIFSFSFLLGQLQLKLPGEFLKAKAASVWGLDFLL